MEHDVDLACLVLGALLALAALIEHVIQTRVGETRARRQAEAQRHINAAAQRLAAQAVELDDLIDDLRRRAVRGREGSETPR